MNISSLILASGKANGYVPGWHSTKCAGCQASKCSWLPGFPCKTQPGCQESSTGAVLGAADPARGGGTSSYTAVLKAVLCTRHRLVQGLDDLPAGPSNKQQRCWSCNWRGLATAQDCWDSCTSAHQASAPFTAPCLLKSVHCTMHSTTLTLQIPSATLGKPCPVTSVILINLALSSNFICLTLLLLMMYLNTWSKSILWYLGVSGSSKQRYIMIYVIQYDHNIVKYSKIIIMVHYSM